jgi:multiple sugar transport system substrate-binding protein
MGRSDVVVKGGFSEQSPNHSSNLVHTLFERIISMKKSIQNALMLALLVTLVLSLTSAASAQDQITLVEWDYWVPPSNQSDVWSGLLDQCAADNNVSIDRQTAPRNDLITRVLLAAQQQQLPDILMIDNPDLQQVASTGALAPLTDYGVDLEGLYPNLIDAGSLDGEVYGIAPGINGMALFYNVDMLDEAGVEPPTTWDEVRDVAAALTGDGVYGIAFSAVATEEGSWQFEPWFWGAGADLTQLDSPEAVQALEFWVDLVESGYASRSVVTWSQGDVNDQFIAGNTAMMQNGVWNLPTLDESGINYNVVPIPMPDGGAAPGPMGGEVLAIPVSGDEARMQAAGEVVNCLLSDESMVTWGNLNAYIPSRQAVAEQVAEDNPMMRSFVDAAAAERARTGPPANLGPNYSKVSQPLWNAIQAALTGAKTPEQALTDAQEQAESAMNE